jgi:hypothetical protein
VAASSNGASAAGASGCDGCRHAATVNAAAVTNTADRASARAWGAARSGIDIGFAGIGGFPDFAGVPDFTGGPDMVGALDFASVPDFADLRGFTDFDLAGFAGVAFLGIGTLLGPVLRGQSRYPGSAPDHRV